VSGCQTCGGFGNRHDEAAHGGWGPPGIPWTEAPPVEPCNGMCVMGNEVMPGQPAHQGHDDDPRGGYYDWAAYPHPDCPRHGDDR
jgi:hypothetical protein